MPSEMEFVNYKEFVAGLSETENPTSTDKQVICNPTDGPRSVPGSAKDRSTTLTAFREGDTIPVDGATLAEMPYADLLRVTAENATTGELSLYYVTEVSKSKVNNSILINSLIDFDTYKVHWTDTGTMSTWSGIQYRISHNIRIGETIIVTGKRNVGNDWSLRVLFIDSSGNQISSVTSSLEQLHAVIPDGTATIEVTWAACWGTKLNSDTDITFTDCAVYYEKALPIKSSFYYVNSIYATAVKSVTNDNRVIEFDKLWNTEQIIFTCKANQRWCGVEKVISGYIPQGFMITVSGDRVSGNDWSVRISCRLSDETVLSQKTSTDGKVSIPIPVGTHHIVITFAGCWGTAFNADTDVTFNNVLVKMAPATASSQGITATPNTSYFLINSKTDENSNPLFSRIYSASEIKGEVTGTYSWQGFEIIINDFIVGQTITAEGVRDVGNDWAIRVGFKDNAGNWISHTTSNTSKCSATIPSGTELVVVTYAACWGSVLPEGTEVTFSNISVYYSVEADNLNELIGSGSSVYYGKNKFTPYPFSGVYRCNRTQILSKTAGDNGVNKFQDNQSSVIFGDYLIEFEASGYAVVFDMTDWSVVATMQLPYVSHAGSACPTSYFVSNDDYFPLIFLASGENAGNLAGVSSFLHIDKDTWTITEYKRIKIDVADYYTYGGNACWDDLNQKIVCINNANGGWQLASDNPIVFRTTPVIDLSTSSQVTLSSSDLQYIGQVPFFVTQGSQICNGRLVIGAQPKDPYWKKNFGIDPWVNCLMVFDLATLEVENFIPVSPNEPEGVSCVNGSVYVTTRHWMANPDRKSVV